MAGMGCGGGCGSPAPFLPNGYMRAPEMRGLGDASAMAVEVGPVGFGIAHGAAVAGSAIGGALIGGLASGGTTGAATGAMLAGGVSATAGGIGLLGLAAIAAREVPEAAPLRPMLLTVGALELVAGAALLWYGGNRAYRSVKAGRPLAGRRGR